MFGFLATWAGANAQYGQPQPENVSSDRRLSDQSRDVGAEPRHGGPRRQVAPGHEGRGPAAVRDEARARRGPGRGGRGRGRGRRVRRAAAARVRRRGARRRRHGPGVVPDDAARRHGLPRRHRGPLAGPARVRGPAPRRPQRRGGRRRGLLGAGRGLQPRRRRARDGRGGRPRRRVECRRRPAPQVPAPVADAAREAPPPPGGAPPRRRRPAGQRVPPRGPRRGPRRRQRPRALLRPVAVLGAEQHARRRRRGAGAGALEGRLHEPLQERAPVAVHGGPLRQRPLPRAEPGARVPRPRRGFRGMFEKTKDTRRTS